MRFVTARTLRAHPFAVPEDLASWTPAKLSLTPLDSRVATYAGILQFLIVNALLVTQPSPGVLELMLFAFRTRGRAVVLAEVVGALVLLAVAHEAAHVAFHPDRGRSSRTLAGLKAFGPFVLYNGGMSRQRFIAYLLGPFLLLTPITVAIVVASGPWWPAAANLFITHLAMTYGDLAMARRFMRDHGQCREVWNAGRRALVR